MRGLLTIVIGSLAGFAFWLLVIAGIAWYQREQLAALKTNWPLVLVQTKCPEGAAAQTRRR